MSRKIEEPGQKRKTVNCSMKAAIHQQITDEWEMRGFRSASHLFETALIQYLKNNPVVAEKDVPGSQSTAKGSGELIASDVESTGSNILLDGHEI